MEDIMIVVRNIFQIKFGQWSEGVGREVMLHECDASQADGRLDR
jgi:hypothetical protein